jgi:hypothetical protein
MPPTHSADSSSTSPLRRSKWIRFNLVMAAVFWLVWLMLGGRFAIHSIVTHWKIALTMMFGSLVGGWNERRRRCGCVSRLHKASAYPGA